MLIVALMSMLFAPPAQPKNYEIAGSGATAIVQVPGGELITINEKPDWLFFSIQAGYEPSDDGPYTNVPAEMSVSLVAGDLQNQLANQRKINIEGQPQILKEIKRDNQVIWLVKDLDPGDGPQPVRAFQFIPAGDSAVMIIDATNNIVRGIPPKNRRTVNELLLVGLKGIRLNGAPVATTEI